MRALQALLVNIRNAKLEAQADVSALLVNIRNAKLEAPSKLVSEDWLEAPSHLVLVELQAATASQNPSKMQVD
jgi:hypothetical protein